MTSALSVTGSTMPTAIRAIEPLDIAKWLAVEPSRSISDKLLDAFTERKPLSARVKRVRKPSLTKAIKAARKAGVDRGTATVGDVSVTFGESEPTTARNPWLASLDEETLQ
jgi:hypothetical protein